jgi:hypothetical protein
LDELSQNNPEAAAQEVPAEGEAAAEEAPAAAMPPSATSQTLANKLFMATSFGWAKTSRSEGDWRGSGVTDFLVGYMLPGEGQMKFAATYRYAPFAVVGEIDDRSYRGVWEAHYFGTNIHYMVNDKIRAVGAAELGYVMVSLNAVDGEAGEEKHAESGASVSLGGGADWKLGDTFAFTAGPRLNAGFGSFTTIQLGAAASFLF